jgi:polysaccharide export outer membrane protein
MTLFLNRLTLGLKALALLGVLGFLSGCATDGSPKSGGQTAAGGPGSPASAAKMDLETLHAGDHLRVEFSGIMPAIPAVETPIKDNGTISLPKIGEVKAAGLKPRLLEEVIRTNYVPDWYKTLNITVTPLDRYIFVGGDVKIPARYAYSDGMTVTKAIQTAGGFTEFANKKNVRLRRAAGGADIIINVKKAIENPEYDKLVYPGDSVMVRRLMY